MDLLNSKKTINSKLKHKKPNPTNLTLAERILANRRKGKEPRADSTSGSVDISDLTNQRDDKDERRTPTPEPTRKSPVIVRSASDDSIRLFSVLNRHDGELENYILEHSINIAPKLEPAYSEPPFPKMQEVNKTYMHTLDSMHLCPPVPSSFGCYDNKSDSEAELESRRTRSRVVHRRRRKGSLSPNPNELTLAQKLFLHKQVMAFRESAADDNVAIDI